MQPRMVYALLIDNAGSVLLVRRRGSVLWALPGGEIRPAVPLDDLLTMYCQRQVGVAPDAFGPVQSLALAGLTFAAASGAVARGRAGARGRVEAVNWVQLHQLPTDTDPVARVAVGLLAREQGATVPTTVSPPVLSPVVPGS